MGALFSDNATGGRVVGNDFVDNGRFAIMVTLGAAPLIRANNICNAKTAGVHFEDIGTRGVLAGNDISGSWECNVEIFDGACPMIEENSIRDGRSAGVLIEGSKGRLVRNDIKNNRVCGVAIKGGSDVQLFVNKIHSRRPGSSVEDSVNVVCSGANTKVALERNFIFDASTGVSVLEGADVSISNNRLYGCAISNVSVRGANSRCRLLSNAIFGGTVGVIAADGAGLVAESNTVYRNAKVHWGGSCRTFLTAPIDQLRLTSPVSFHLRPPPPPVMLFLSEPGGNYSQRQLHGAFAVQQHLAEWRLRRGAHGRRQGVCVQQPGTPQQTSGRRVPRHFQRMFGG